MGSRDSSGVEINGMHYAKNVAGFIGFLVLLLYGAFQLSQDHESGGQLLIGMIMFVAFVAAVRSGRRILLIRKILAEGRR